MPTETKYQLILDETVDAEELNELLKKQNNLICKFCQIWLNFQKFYIVDIDEEDENPSENEEASENGQEEAQELKITDDQE